MKATKFTLTLKAEVLSMDSITTLLTNVAACIDKETKGGKLVFEDGDAVEWDTKEKPVTF